MRGKRCAGLRLALLAAALLGAGAAALAKDAAPSTDPELPSTVIVLDASSSMNDKVGGASKITIVRSELGKAIGTYGDRLSFGLVAFGHRKASNCADSEIVAKPGALTAETQAKTLGAIKPKGAAPVAAALSDAAKTVPGANAKLEIVLIADGGDSCDADVCATAASLKQKSEGLRIHVIGLDDKAASLKPLACVAAATGGTFVAATTQVEFKQALVSVLDAASGSGAAEPAAADGASDQGAESGGGGDAAPNAAAAATPNAEDAPTPAPVRTIAIPPPVIEPQGAEQSQSTAPKSEPQAAPSPPPSGETAVNKSVPAQGQALAPAKPAAPIPPAPELKLPVPVTFKALVTEQGPKLDSGLVWRVYSAALSPDGTRKLIATHREAMPTAALLPGDYLVNAAYGLSNLTKKIKVESGKSIEETFVLNTGALKLAATLPNGDPLPEGSVRFDIFSDEEDQFGNRHRILANAKPGVVIRLNAGAYHIVSLYGDANASVKCDVTVEPGKITEATVKQTGAKITFKLVQTLGGEALADTKWKILTSAGDVVKENAGALPTHILANGSYAVVADHGGLDYTRKFSIESSDPKQIEVVVDDGPTSADALKQLLDPPPPPPPSPPPAPSGGAIAGDGAPSGNTGLGFDSSPADPNAPLINPGALLRPAR
jgi:Mg-chelatase subunit ChlD